MLRRSIESAGENARNATVGAARALDGGIIPDNARIEHILRVNNGDIKWKTGVELGVFAFARGKRKYKVDAWHGTVGTRRIVQSAAKLLEVTHVERNIASASRRL